MEVKQLKKELKVQQKLSDALDLDRADRGQYSNPYAREVERLKALIKIVSYGIEFDATDYSKTGMIELKNYKGEPIVYALRTGKWKYKNFPRVWYPSKSFDQFVEKFIRSQ